MLVLWNHPKPVTVLVITLLVLIGIVVIEIVGREPAPAPKIP